MNPETREQLEVLRDRAESVLSLGHSLLSIAHAMEWYDDIDEDLSWLGKPSLPDPPKRGAEYAVANMRSLSDDIHKAEDLAKKLLGGDLRRQVREALALARAMISQADVPAECATTEGEEEKSIEICRNALHAAYGECGSSLKRLAAAVIVMGEDACLQCNDPASNAIDGMKEDRDIVRALSVTPESLAILFALDLAKPATMTIEALDRIAGLSDRTVRNNLKALEAAGLVHRPCGPKKGCTLTAAGDALLERRKLTG